jgi:hypothetical protein
MSTPKDGSILWALMEGDPWFRSLATTPRTFGKVLTLNGLMGLWLMEPD